MSKQKYYLPNKPEIISKTSSEAGIVEVRNAICQSRECLQTYTVCVAVFGKYDVHFKVPKAKNSLTTTHTHINSLSRRIYIITNTSSIEKREKSKQER